MSPERVNAWLDRLPRTRFGRLGREVPAFRSCGVAGYYVALVATLAGGLLTGRSLLVLGILSAVCAFSFFAWAQARRAITGREELVLLEHVWIAELASALALRALGEPALPYLDVISVGLSFFLAAGRVGCTLVGCCHGAPSEIGIVYGEAHVRDGFSRHLAGVRLLPVPLLEAASLAAVGVTGLAALPFCAPGSVIAWFLAAYAIVRFGLEGLRGDARPHALGLSVGRWMAIVELAAALAIKEHARLASPSVKVACAVALTLVIVAGIVDRRRLRRTRALLDPAHAASLRAIVRSAPRDVGAGPLLQRTAQGVGVAVSAAGPDEGVHVSLRLPDGQRDLAALCALAARALPELHLETARLAGEGELLFLHVTELLELARETAAALEIALYGAVVRRFQDRGQALVREPRADPPPAPPEPADPAPPGPAAPARSAERLNYYGVKGRGE
jgi:hypothetical protein